MPTPGSHRYDQQRQRIRREFEKRGTPDPEAEERADRAMNERDTQETYERVDRQAGRKSARR